MNFWSRWNENFEGKKLLISFAVQFITDPSFQGKKNTENCRFLEAWVAFCWFCSFVPRNLRLVSTISNAGTSVMPVLRYYKKSNEFDVFYGSVLTKTTWKKKKKNPDLKYQAQIWQIWASDFHVDLPCNFPRNRITRAMLVCLEPMLRKACLGPIYRTARSWNKRKTNFPRTSSIPSPVL